MHMMVQKFYSTCEKFYIVGGQCSVPLNGGFEVTILAFVLVFPRIFTLQGEDAGR